MAADKGVSETVKDQEEKQIIKAEYYAPNAYDGKQIMEIVGQIPKPPPTHQHNTPMPSLGYDLKSESTLCPSVYDLKSVSSSAQEKGNIWDGYQDDEIPDKKQSRPVRNLRHQVFSLYRRLFSVVFITNMSIFIATLARGGANAEQLGLIVVANLFCAILMRQDYVINAFFTVACSVPNTCVHFITRLICPI